MTISEIRIRLADEHDRKDRLLAFCSITLDHSFVIRDLKIINGLDGLFVAMPNRRITDRCPQCSNKNHLSAKFCNNCAYRLAESRVARDMNGRAKLFADIAFPTNQTCREALTKAIVEAYTAEIERAKQPDYICRFSDFGSLADRAEDRHGS